MKLLRQVRSVKKEILTALLIFVATAAIFFYQAILKGYIPFPGDLLVGNYEPYKSYSFLGFPPGGVPHKAQGFDVLKLLYPAKEFAVGMLTEGQWPLWNPYTFSGNPLFASMQAGIFYPFTLIFLTVPFLPAWSFYILLQPILSGLFTFFLLREFQLSFKSSLLGGLAYGFSSYMVVWIEYGNIGHTILWLPLAFLLLYKNLKKPSIVRIVALIFILTFSLLAGYIQLTIYLFIFLASFLLFYLIVFQKEQRLKIFFLHLPIFIAPALLSAVQLLPTIELFLNSTRSPYTLDAFIKLLIPPFYIVSAFVPDFFGNPATRNYWLTGTYIERVSYIGVVPLFFAIYGLMQKRTPLTLFFAGCLVVIFFLVFDTFVAKALYGVYMPPILSTGVPSRMMFLFCFCLAILAAFGYDSFEKTKSLKLLIKAFAIVGGIYLLLWIFVFAGSRILQNDWVVHLAVSKRNLLLPTGIFAVLVLIIIASWRVPLIKRYVFIMLFGLTIFELFYFFHKITPFSPKEAVYPQTEVIRELKKLQGIDRSWGYGSAYLEANIQTHEKIYMPHGYDALHIHSYGELLSSSYDGKIAETLPRSEADVAPGYGPDALRENPFRQKILNVLGVKYILHKISPSREADFTTFPKEIYKLVWQNSPWQIYENLATVPRVFLTSDYVVVKNKNETFSTFFAKDFNEKKTLILSVDPHITRGDFVGTVEVLRYEPNDVTLATSSQSDSLLFLSDNYYPGWKASIDEKETKIYLADYTFRAVVLPKGDHTVRFFYEPNSFRSGVWLSAISFVILVVLFLKFRKYEIS